MKMRYILAAAAVAAAFTMQGIPAHAATARACPVPVAGYADHPWSGGNQLKVYLKSNLCGELVRAQEYCQTGFLGSSHHYHWATGVNIKAVNHATRKPLSSTNCGTQGLAALRWGFENYNGQVHHWTFHQAGTQKPKA